MLAFQYLADACFEFPFAFHVYVEEAVAGFAFEDFSELGVFAWLQAKSGDDAVKFIGDAVEAGYEDDAFGSGYDADDGVPAATQSEDVLEVVLSYVCGDVAFIEVCGTGFFLEE